MARNVYGGYCRECGKWTPPGFGHFERYRGGWRVHCIKCASGRELPPEALREKRIPMTDCIESGEAREIAKKLRYTADDDLGGLSLQKNLAAITKAEDGSWRGVMRRLADLIDRPSTTRHGKFRTKYGRETPCCDVCGYSIGDMRWNHCPKCGAVIADD